MQKRTDGGLDYIIWFFYMFFVRINQNKIIVGCFSCNDWWWNSLWLQKLTMSFESTHESIFVLSGWNAFFPCFLVTQLTLWNFQHRWSEPSNVVEKIDLSTLEACMGWALQYEMEYGYPAPSSVDVRDRTLNTTDSLLLIEYYKTWHG